MITDTWCIDSREVEWSCAEKARPTSANPYSVDEFVFWLRGIVSGLVAGVATDVDWDLDLPDEGYSSIELRRFGHSVLEQTHEGAIEVTPQALQKIDQEWRGNLEWVAQRVRIVFPGAGERPVTIDYVTDPEIEDYGRFTVSFVTRGTPRDTAKQVVAFYRETRLQVLSEPFASLGLVPSFES